MGSTKAKPISRQNRTPKDNEEIAREITIIRDFHNLEQIPLCCDLLPDKDLMVKLEELPIELLTELIEILEYGFQPYAMKDWITKDILSEITGLDPNSLRDQKFRKSKFDFRDPSSWGGFLKNNRLFHQVWEEERYAGLHEMFFSSFLNRVLTNAEQYLHLSFSRDHPKLKVCVREVIDFLDNKFDPGENHGRIVADTSAITEIYAATQIAKLKSFMLYLTHNMSFDDMRELVRNSSTLITKKGAAGNSFDYLMTVDRNKLGCLPDGKDNRFLIIYGEVKGITEMYTSTKGSRGTYQEPIVGSNNRNRIMIGEDFLVKVSEIRYHLIDRYSKLGWDSESTINLYQQISEDYAAMVPIGRVTKGRSRFQEMYGNENSSRSPYHSFGLTDGNLDIKRLEYVALNRKYRDSSQQLNIAIVPDNSERNRKKYSVFDKDKKYSHKLLDPYSKENADEVNTMINQSFGKSSRRILTYYGTSQSGKLTSRKCGFSGRLEGVKDVFLTINYIAESILNSMNSVSYTSSHLKGNQYNNRWGKIGAKALHAGKFADPEIAHRLGISDYYEQLYDRDTKKATDFRRSRRTNWRVTIHKLKDKGLLSEAKRYQQFANLVLSEFHDYITSFNTKIQRFKPLNELD